MDDLLLGMPTLIELPNLRANTDLCRRLGLSFVELNMNSPAFQPQTLQAGELAGLGGEQRIGFSIHLPEQLDLGSFQEDIRSGQVACVARAMAWAREAGIERLTMHLDPGVYFSLPEERVWLYRKHGEAYLANLVDSVDRVLSPHADEGLRLLIENTGRFGLDFMREAADVLLRRFAPGVGLTWDVGHDAADGHVDRPFLQQHVDEVAEVHLHDFDGRSAHLPLFAGQVDFAWSLGLARERGLPVVLETKTAAALEASVRALRERGIV